MINAEWYNKSHYIYKLYLKFLQIPNNIVKIKDSENRLQINGNLNCRFSIIKKLFATNFGLAIVESNDKSHYMYKLFLKLIPIALSYSKN